MNFIDKFIRVPSITPERQEAIIAAFPKTIAHIQAVIDRAKVSHVYALKAKINLTACNAFGLLSFSNKDNLLNTDHILAALIELCMVIESPLSVDILVSEDELPRTPSFTDGWVKPEEESEIESEIEFLQRILSDFTHTDVGAALRERLEQLQPKPELLPCAHCGGEAVIKPLLDTNFKEKGCIVECKRCPIQTSYGYGENYIDREKAIDAWNKRTNN